MEIQKLDPLRDNFLTMVKKHNELVDAVNELQKNPTISKMENVDPYAEQRKWIGKACWFWDGGAKTRAFGKLNQVDTEYNDAPFQSNFGKWYEHCEPVKPDDDIIYKGSENSNIKKLRYVEQYEYDKLQSENKVEPDCLYIIK